MGQKSEKKNRRQMEHTIQMLTDDNLRCVGVIHQQVKTFEKVVKLPLSVVQQLQKIKTVSHYDAPEYSLQDVQNAVQNCLDTILGGNYGSNDKVQRRR